MSWREFKQRVAHELRDCIVVGCDGGGPASDEVMLIIVNEQRREVNMRVPEQDLHLGWPMLRTRYLLPAAAAIGVTILA